MVVLGAARPYMPAFEEVALPLYKLLANMEAEQDARANMEAEQATLGSTVAQQLQEDIASKETELEQLREAAAGNAAVMEALAEKDETIRSLHTQLEEMQQKQVCYHTYGLLLANGGQGRATMLLACYSMSSE